jgi:hypothetical protein
MKSADNNNDIIQTIPVEELDWIFLSYDEPEKDKFYRQIVNKWPWTKRVDGVKGSDSAHKAAAELSETERFILIDGDNIPHDDFSKTQLSITRANAVAQFRWRARNHINGLHYGNGGISSWTKSYVRNMRTHENTDGSNKTNIEFCFDPLYWPMHNCYSTTYPNGSPKQAWRAGFREGVKMCSKDGVMPDRNDLENFQKYVWRRNLQNLSIWQTLGRDVHNGFWAIYGARLGTHYLMLRDWDYTTVRDFDELDKLWSIHCNDDEAVCREIGIELNRCLGLNIVEIDDAGSSFFKQYISRSWYNRDPMLKEIDVIRQEEGW